jgi:hypothetical protein
VAGRLCTEEAQQEVTKNADLVRNLLVQDPKAQSVFLELMNQLKK